MRAAVYSAYGGPEVIDIVDVPKPEPRQGELLVRVHASSVTSGDARVRAFDVPKPFVIPGRLALGWPRPKDPRMGHEFAGEVEAIGPGATRFKPGDRVYGVGEGCHAQYCTIAEAAAVAYIPEDLTFAEAVSLPFGVTTAMYFFDRGRVGAGHSVLIVGASGCVGAYSIQYAKALGAHVTAVCSARNAEMVRRLGADRLIDYTSEAYTSTGSYDAVMDCVGAIDFPRARPILKRGGVFLNVVMTGTDLLSLLSPFKGGRRIVSGTFNATRPMLLKVGELVSGGAVIPVLDRTYTLDQVREAHAYVDTKRKRGAVVLTIS